MPNINCNYFPQIKVVNYSSITFDYDLYHLYLNDKFEGCYMSKADLLERLSELCINEVSKYDKGTIKDTE